MQLKLSLYVIFERTPSGRRLLPSPRVKSPLLSTAVIVKEKSVQLVILVLHKLHQHHGHKCICDLHLTDNRPLAHWIRFRRLNFHTFHYFSSLLFFATFLHLQVCVLKEDHSHLLSAYLLASSLLNFTSLVNLYFVKSQDEENSLSLP